MHSAVAHKMSTVCLNRPLNWNVCVLRRKLLLSFTLYRSLSSLHADYILNVSWTVQDRRKNPTYYVFNYLFNYLWYIQDETTILGDQALDTGFNVCPLATINNHEKHVKVDTGHVMRGQGVRWTWLRKAFHSKEILSPCGSMAARSPVRLSLPW